MNQFNHSNLAMSDFDSADTIENSFFDADAALQYDEAALQQQHENFLGIRGKKGRAKVQARKLEKAQFKNDLEQVRSGMTIGEVRAQQVQAMQQLNNTAAVTGLQPETVALANVAANAPTVASYVEQQGLIPQQNPAALAMQATQAFVNEVENRQNEGVPDWDTAQDSVIQDYQESWDEADNFFGSILQSVFAAGKALVEKINVKRTAKGKKPLFGGKGWKKIAEKVADNKEVVTDSMNSAEKAFLALTKKEVTEAVRKEKQSAVGAGADALINDQKKQAIKEYLPYALVAAVLIFVIAKHT